MGRLHERVARAPGGPLSVGRVARAAGVSRSALLY